MGLDMYAFARSIAPDQPVDFASSPDEEELHYWRKHPNLHGWMEKLYRAKGGSREDFNVAPVALTLEDLDRLEFDITARMLPETSGFFFGQSWGTKEERDEDLEFVAKARAAISEGKTVYYTSWW